FTNWYYLFTFILAFRLTIYIYRKLSLPRKDSIITALRVTFPIVSFVLFYNSIGFIYVIILLGASEIIDRIEFYNELNVPDPKTEMNLKN
ncbi:hypothetical protein ACFLSE_02390, partial [Bacteroidota bacterium]